MPARLHAPANAFLIPSLADVAPSPQTRVGQAVRAAKYLTFAVWQVR